MLKRRGIAVLRVIFDWRETRGYSPTIREIGNELGIASTNGVRWHLDILEQQGLLLRDAQHARTMRLTDLGLAVIQLEVERDPTNA